MTTQSPYIGFESKRQTDKYCQNCGHHGSFHQLITRDKWEKLGEFLTPGRIPWFCEHVEINPITEEEKICTCNNFTPSIMGR